MTTNLAPPATKRPRKPSFPGLFNRDATLNSSPIAPPPPQRPPPPPPAPQLPAIDFSNDNLANNDLAPGFFPSPPSNQTLIGFGILQPPSAASAGHGDDVLNAHLPTSDSIATSSDPSTPPGEQLSTATLVNQPVSAQAAGRNYIADSHTSPKDTKSAGKEKKHMTLFKRNHKTKPAATEKSNSSPSLLKDLAVPELAAAKKSYISGPISPTLGGSGGQMSEQDVAAGKMKKSIGTPFNFERKVHVDVELNWFGSSTDPAELFDLEEKLGEGAFGCVYRAILKQTGFILAVKEIQLHDIRGQTATDQQAMIEKEISLLKKCVHRNTVQYYGCCRRAANLIWILTDFCGGGSMADVLGLLASGEFHIPGEADTNAPGGFPKTIIAPTAPSAAAAAADKAAPSGLTFNEVAAVLGGALEGLTFLHAKSIIHRDLKSANILLSGDGEVKIADFGVSEQLTQTVKNRNTVVGTPLFMSPEVILGADYATSADIWSFGITAVELADGVPPHWNENPMRVLFKIPHLPAPAPSHPTSAYDPAYLDFIQLCLKKKPDERASAMTLLAHPFVKIFAGGPGARRLVLSTKARMWAEGLKLKRARAKEADRRAAVAQANEDKWAVKKTSRKADAGEEEKQQQERHEVAIESSWESVVVRDVDGDGGEADAGEAMGSSTMIIHDDGQDGGEPNGGPVQTVFLKGDESTQPDPVAPVPATSGAVDSVSSKVAAMVAALSSSGSRAALSLSKQPSAQNLKASRSKGGSDWLLVKDDTTGVSADKPSEPPAGATATVSPGGFPRASSSSASDPVGRFAQQVGPYIEIAGRALGSVVDKIEQVSGVQVRQRWEQQWLGGAVGVHVVYISMLIGVHLYYSRQIQSLQVVPGGVAR